MSRTLSCLIRRIVVAKSGKRTEDAFELIGLITTQFRQVDYIGIDRHGALGSPARLLADDHLLCSTFGLF